MIKIEKIIRDPLYEGYIGITQEEREIIELPVFQRLRRVSQLSFGDLVYPNANHNRFAHSLGVLHLAGLIGAFLKEKGYIKDEEVRILRLAGLLHDLGHGPFSHAFEPVLADFILKDGKPWTEAHIRYGQKLIYETPEILKKIGKETAKQICSLIKGEEFEGENPNNLMKTIMKGLFSLDRLDYLRRDAYHAGTPEYGQLDIIRILSSFLWEGDTVYYSKKGVYALAMVIFSYFHMYQALYFHHAVRAAFCLCQDILWTASNQGVFREIQDIEKWKKFWPSFDDYKCLEIISQKGNEEVKEKVQSLLNRKLPKRILNSEDFRGKADLKFEIYGLCAPARYKEKMDIESKIREELKVKTFYIDSPEVTPYPYITDEEIKKIPLIAFKEEQPSVFNEVFHKVVPPVKGLWEKPDILRIYIEKIWKNDEEKQKLKSKILDILTDKLLYKRKDKEV